MMNLNFKNEKGITMITLAVTIAIMLIITTTLLYNITTGANVKSLDNMYSDITKIKNKIDIYYSKYNAIPILETKYENVSDAIKDINPNDNDTYYVIDLEALENLTLIYGQDYSIYKNTPSNNLKDLYIINERSHSVYYAKGIIFDDKVYYTKPSQNTELNLSATLDIRVINEDDDGAYVKISAVDKTNGIKKITVIVDGSEVKEYEYTLNLFEIKTEILKIDFNNQEQICYFKIEDENGENTSVSETITIK